MFFDVDLGRQFLGVRYGVSIVGPTVACALAIACGGRGPRVHPSEGGAAGGDRVRFEGVELGGHGAPIVYVGLRAAKAVVVESPWLLTFVTPEAEALGTVGIRLELADGETLALPQAFTYVRSAVVLSPASRR